MDILSLVRDDRKIIPSINVRRFCGHPSPRTWRDWRSACHVPRRARMLTQFQALSLHVCAKAGRPLDRSEVYGIISAELRRNPRGISSYLRKSGMTVSAKNLDTALLNMTGHLPSRATLYKVGSRLGIPYRVGATYTQEQVTAYAQNLYPARARA